MSDKLAAAQAALNSGDKDAAIAQLVAAVDEDPARPVQVYRVLALQLYSTNRFIEGEVETARALARYPRDFDLLNIRGVLLRKLRRQREAVAVLERAIRSDPKNLGAQQNLGNVLLDLNEAVRAEGVFAKLVRAQPRNAEFQRQLGRSLLKQGKTDAAMVRFRQATMLEPTRVDAWLDTLGAMVDHATPEEIDALMERALAANPGERRLLEARVTSMRRAGQLRRAQTFLEELLPTNGETAWIHYQYGMLTADWDRARANGFLRKAAALEPDKLDYKLALIESLDRTRTGDEGGHIEESYQLLKEILPRQDEFTEANYKIAAEVLIRVCDFENLARLGDFRTLGRKWAETGRHGALLKQLARVKSHEDRLELLEQHRIWGRLIDRNVAGHEIRRPPKRAPGGKIRLGFLSSDLRAHPVGYFALPLFDHMDRERFEVFIYSFYQGQEDSAQRHITEQVTAYRWWPEVSIAGAAERIAADQLDMLIELGGSTHMNKPEVMAYRPAPLQGSWLGYPHSLGLESIDYLVCDPHNVPDPSLLIEKPLMMPKTWIALGARFFSNATPITEAPEIANGFITYGTANNPHKYTSDVLRTWARIVARTPNSKFAFIRPEGSGASFRANIEREFAAEGVTPDRLVWHVIRGAHLPFYNQVDITLDTFPLTGGTTTTETLWMGVPVISLIGEAFYERLSASIMANTGVADLAADNLAAYEKLALDLAADRPRRLELRATLRDRMKTGPLGQTEQFAKDFYDLIARTVRG